MKLPMNGQRVRRRIWETLSRGTRDYLRETSFAHTTRIATEAGSAGVERRPWTKSTAAAGQVLVVRPGREAIPSPSLRGPQDLEAPDQRGVERHRHPL